LDDIVVNGFTIVDKINALPSADICEAMWNTGKSEMAWAIALLM